MNILYTILIIAAIAAIIYMIHDDATFWADAKKAAKGENTTKYFTEFNKTKNK